MGALVVPMRTSNISLAETINYLTWKIIISSTTSGSSSFDRVPYLVKLMVHISRFVREIEPQIR
jgi:hypothetical protein